jgi:hypothetical protein
MTVLVSTYYLANKASLRKPRANAWEKIWAHSFDYDLYLKYRISPSQRSGYAVFLDQNLVYHPDLMITGSQQSTTAAEYFPVLNRFFHIFEQRSGLRVIIAAQPRAQYAFRSDIFGGAKLFLGKQQNLFVTLKLCSRIILHRFLFRSCGESQ